MTPPGRMTTRQIRDEIVKLDAARDAAGDALIAAGRGYERASETRDRAREGDALAIAWRDAADRWTDLRCEIEIRERYGRAWMRPGFVRVPV